MWTRKLLKKNAKVAFKRNYWRCVVVSWIAVILGVTIGSGVSLNSSSNLGGSSNNNDYYEEWYDDDYDDDDDYYYNEDENLLHELFKNDVFKSVVLPITLIFVAVVAILIIAFGILVTNVASVGHKRYYLENREHKTNIGTLFYGFRGGRYGSNVWIMFWKELVIFGWTLLLVIPGIIKAYAYMMIPYILAENPEISKERAFEISREMMKGHKWEAFVLSLSFLGWEILGMFTVGLLGIFYVNPYVDATFAEFYTALKAEAFSKGITNEIELPGVKYPKFNEQTVGEF